MRWTVHSEKPLYEDEWLDIRVWRPVLPEAEPGNRKSTPRRHYFRSCRAITIRWTWLVPS